MTGWTARERARVVSAVAAAPSVHDTQPWLLEFRDDHVALRERLDQALPRHDPLGRDRLIACGAALEHVRLAVRVLGRSASVELRADPADPAEVARVPTTGPSAPTDADLRRHRAIAERVDHRRPFAAEPVGKDLRLRLLGAHAVDGVSVRPLADPAEIAALAGLLHRGALMLRTDRTYQRELAAWTSPVRRPLPGGGVAAAARRVSTLPWAGPVRPTTAVPGVGFLADRLSREFLLLVQTREDGKHDHVRAGMAAEQTWLAATAAALAGSVLTQPFRLPGTGSGLVPALSSGGFPHLLLRFGHP